MIGKIFNFLVSVAVNGFFALIVTGIFYVIFAIVLGCAMIPVQIILGHAAAAGIEHFLDALTFRVVYTIVFLALMLEDLGGGTVRCKVKSHLKKKR